MKSKAKRFKAVLEKGERSLGWTIARLPFAAEALGELVRLRVRGTVKGPSGVYAFRTSLFPAAESHAPGAEAAGAFYLLVNRAMQRGAGVRLGVEAEFSLEADLDERPAELPDELAALLDGEPGLMKWYETLSEYTRRELGKWVIAAKSGQARLRRAEQAAERLLATMEGERELPPVLEAAFRLRPKARIGWSKMTEAQRRGELMAIFCYQAPESRQKRVSKLCDGAEKRAG